MSHVAFLVLAHHKPEQAGRLIHRLVAPGARLYIHIDAKAALEPFLAAAPTEAVFLENRVSVEWGRFGPTQAALRLIDRALEDNPSHLYLLSGQDYPLLPTTEILRRITNPDREFMTYVRMGTPGAGKPMWRVTQRLSPLRFVSRTTARRFRLLFHALNMALPKRDVARCAPGVTLYGGPTWWCVTAETMRRMRAFLDAQPGLMRLMEKAHIPDEIVFQTSYMAVAADRPVEQQPTMVVWDRSRGPTESPETLTMEHAELLTRTPKLFARKFDMDTDAAVLDWLDARSDAMAAD